MKAFVMHLVLAVGVLLFVAGVVVGWPVVAGALALHFSALWSWVTVQALVGVVVGSFLFHHAHHELHG